MRTFSIFKTTAGQDDQVIKCKTEKDRGTTLNHKTAGTYYVTFSFSNIIAHILITITELFVTDVYLKTNAINIFLIPFM